MVQQVNATVNAVESMGDFAGYSGVATGVVFIAIIIMIFILSKNIRQFFLGAVVTGITFGIYKLSRWMGVSAAVEHNYKPITWFGYIVGFIVVSIIVGRILQKMSFMKKLEEILDNEKEK